MNPCQPAAKPRTRARRHVDLEAARANAVTHPAPFQVEPDASVHTVLELMDEHWAALSARLTPEHAQRSRVLLEDLRLYALTDSPGWRSTIDRSFPDLLTRWVCAATRRDEYRPRTDHPLLSMYRFDNWDLFMEWAFGYCLAGAGFDRQAGFIDAPRCDPGPSSSALRKLTMDITSILVDIAIPEHGQLRWGKQVLAEPGGLLSGNLARFYASQTVFHDVRLADPEHRWFESLLIPVTLHAQVEGCPDNYEPLAQAFEIPDSWIVECYENEERSAVWGAVDWVDVPAALETLLRPKEVRKHTVRREPVPSLW